MYMYSQSLNKATNGENFASSLFFHASCNNLYNISTLFMFSPGIAHFRSFNFLHLETIAFVLMKLV